MNRRTSARSGALVAAGAALATLLTACGSGGDGAAAHLPGTNPNQQVAGDQVTVTHRWWSTPKEPVGSVIDAAAPTSGAHGLKPSRRYYCRVLTQTVHDKGALAGISGNDPAVLTATEAFVAETTALAPAPVHKDWQVLGNAMVKLAASHGDLSSVHGVNAKATNSAAVAIAKDAKTQCGVDVSTSTRPKPVKAKAKATKPTSAKTAKTAKTATKKAATRRH